MFMNSFWSLLGGDTDLSAIPDILLLVTMPLPVPKPRPSPPDPEFSAVLYLLISWAAGNFDLSSDKKSP